MADWQKGDLALCIESGPWREMHTGKPRDLPVRSGMVLTVEAVGRGDDDRPALWFVGFPNDHRQWLFSSRRFPKVTPPKADEFDKEVISLMTTKPSKVEA